MILIVVLCLCLTSIYQVNGTRIISKEEELELERQLKLINKPPIKSIQTKFGHIVDCIDINKQLAFDHPLLKDHKIQERPHFSKRTTKNAGLSQNRPLMIGLQQDACPSGTVPIRRTTKADLIAIRSMSNIIYPQTTKVPNTHRAVIQMRTSEFHSYIGVNGNINVYNPVVKEGSSYAVMYVMNGADEKLISITTGWMVSPSTYKGTPYSYFFTFWTTDGADKTGCFNIACPGFVQVDKRVYPGSPISNVSTPNGPQFEIGLSISKADDGNWWVTKDQINIGYFPAALFNNLANFETVGWGGIVVSPPNGISPPMGSGIFPDDNYGHTSQFRAIQYKNSSGVLDGPHKYTYDTIIDSPNCYLIDFHGYIGEHEGYTFGFGGPGGDCGI
ncbi:uncharacterized protein LOC126722427 [Quercus robur]|uniref:uncharacterized protein LOC126722427 n=1 Tax=Quercus robur TaxID=38942 RepID=UPI002163485F|nr:uncharacterized protein LOC126722427 [Quercus robur]